MAWKNTSGLPISVRWNLTIERLANGLQSMKADRPVF
jgi:hypothetical protein